MRKDHQMDNQSTSRRGFLGRLGALVGGLAAVPFLGSTAQAGRSRFRGFYGGYRRSGFRGYGGYRRSGFRGYGYRRSGFRGFGGYPGGFYGGGYPGGFYGGGYPGGFYGGPAYGIPGGGYYNRGYGPGFYGGPGYGGPGIFLRLEGPPRRSVSQALSLLEA